MMAMLDATWPQGFIELSVHRSMLQVLSPLLWVFDLSINLSMFATGQCYIKFSINESISLSPIMTQMKRLECWSTISWISQVLLDLWMELAKLATRLLCTEMDVGTLSLRNIPGSRQSKTVKSLIFPFKLVFLTVLPTVLLFYAFLLFCFQWRLCFCFSLRVRFSGLCFEHPLDFRLHQGSQRRIPQFLPQILGKLLCA